MANEITQKQGTQIFFGDTGTTFSPTSTANDWSNSPTKVYTQLNSIADDAARESDKADFTANRAARFSVMASIELQATPTTGTAVDFFFAPSPSATAGNSNVAGGAGQDTGAPSSVATGSITLDEYLDQCDYVGSLIVSNDVAVQSGFVGVYEPKERYGQLITVNRTGATFATDDAEHHVVFNPIIDEVA
jgi:hypothetical protein